MTFLHMSYMFFKKQKQQQVKPSLLSEKEARQGEAYRLGIVSFCLQSVIPVVLGYTSWFVCHCLPY